MDYKITTMKYTFFLLTTILFLTNCGEPKRQNYTTLNDEGNIVMTTESIHVLEKIQQDYDACKSLETDDRECNQFTAEAICRFYEIEDFKKDENYIDYSAIKDVVTLNGGMWEPLGLATDQDVLNLAQDNANNVKATIAFDPLKSDHVAVILPGKMQQSGSWKLNVPNSASFFVHKPESYIDKGLSYSFSSPEGIILYARKK
jgi:hypothetical protein